MFDINTTANDSSLSVHQQFLAMKIVLVFCFIAAATALSRKPQYVPNEFILRLDETIASTIPQQMAIARVLKGRFSLDVIRPLKVGKLRFLLLKGNALHHFEEISNLRGVLNIEHHALGYIDQVCEEQPSSGTWGLDRVDQRERLDYTNPESDDATYIQGLREGDNTAVYVVDTGVDINHFEFEGRARWGYSTPGLPNADDNGHGTHVAGTIGARSYGVAKQVEIVAVKVINQHGGGTAADFIDAMDWILADHQVYHLYIYNMNVYII